ncbi:MAG: hypothetical protein U0I51_14305 [Muricomes sp.]|uniref:hypothetical protein n=1 Tax=Faecalicatena contorta TaxID=39482 RepID=UPI002EAD9B57|nr:hypothetical protein [Muricomes sp.]
MTNRENFKSLIKRKGYEHVPVEFVLCPSLQEQMKARFGTDDYEEYFGFPWKKIEDIRLLDHDTEIELLPVKWTIKKIKIIFATRCKSWWQFLCCQHILFVFFKRS